MLNPWVLLSIVLAFIATNAGSFFYGQHVEAGEQAQARQAAIDQAIKEHEADALIDMQAAFESGVEQSKVRVVTRTIREQVDRVVDRQIYRDCRIDDSGLSLWNAANRGILDQTPPGKPDTATPGTADIKRPVDGGDAAKPR